MDPLGACGIRAAAADLPVNAGAVFRRKMENAGVGRRDRVAIAVSGGADSMALCLLAIQWSESKGNLFGLTVDHGFRAESAREVVQVRTWLRTLGIECEILQCSWPSGIPSTGHLQERAREARYELLQDACRKNGASVLLTAHHADDQAELFALRLSRSSGDNGLACMALATELFPAMPSITANAKLLLVRPLLELQKKDLYDVCKIAAHPWIEDPTNCKTIYARNRIRKELAAMSDTMRHEVQDLIAVYRKKRSLLHAQINDLMSAFVHTDTDYGYAIVDAEALLAETNDANVLETFLAAVLRFVSQRPKPPRGTAVRRAREWIINRANEGGLTVAGCSLCLQPGTRCSKILVAYSPDSPRPGLLSSRQQKHASSAAKIGTTTSRKFTTVIENAREEHIISGATADFLIALAEKMAADMDPKSRDEAETETETTIEQPDESILLPNQNTYYMQRYLISWDQQCDNAACPTGICSLSNLKLARIRHFSKNDLADIRRRALENENSHADVLDAWRKLKSLPEYVRRGLPVLVTQDNSLITVPSVGFRSCQNTGMSVVFCPKLPLDGGHAVW